MKAKYRTRALKNRPSDASALQAVGEIKDRDASNNALVPKSPVALILERIANSKLRITGKQKNQFILPVQGTKRD